MADIVDAPTRSRMMAGIRGRNTRPELLLRRALHAAGFRYRLNVASLPGRPDIVLSRYRAAVFVHGCFWHRHTDCRYTTTPGTRPDFWAAKFDANVRRDRAAQAELLEKGWRVGVVWECGTRSDIAGVAAELQDWLRGSARQVEIPARPATSGLSTR